MKKKCLVVFAMLCIIATSEAKDPPPLLLETTDQTLPAPPADKAQIILLEPINKLQGMFPVGTFLVENDKRTLIATTAFHNKAIVLLEPGQHMLMSTQGLGFSAALAHLMEVNVEAGKRYFVLLRFIYAQGFQMRPIRTTEVSDYSLKAKDFTSWLNDTRLVERTAEADAFFAKQSAKIDKGYAEAKKTWAGKSLEQRAQLTLNFEDAVPIN